MSAILEMFIGTSVRKTSRDTLKLKDLEITTTDFIVKRSDV